MARITIRVSDVLRGKLIEEAGDYGTISNVVRLIVERFFETKKTLGMTGKKS